MRAWKVVELEKLEKLAEVVLSGGKGWGCCSISGLGLRRWWWW
jgi:hypothetical protein